VFLVLAGRERSLTWDEGGARRVVVVEQQVVVVEQQVVVVEQRWEKREAEGESVCVCERFLRMFVLRAEVPRSCSLLETRL